MWEPLKLWQKTKTPNNSREGGITRRAATFPRGKDDWSLAIWDINSLSVPCKCRRLECSRRKERGMVRMVALGGAIWDAVRFLIT
jgi:hypothetical protein